MHNNAIPSPLLPVPGTITATDTTPINFNPVLVFLKAIRNMHREGDYRRRPGIQRADGHIYYPVIRVVATGN